MKWLVINSEYSLHPLCNRGLKCGTILKMQHLSACLIHIYIHQPLKVITYARMHPETLDYKGAVMSLDVL